VLGPDEILGEEVMAEIYQIGHVMRCPMCRGDEFTVESEGEFRVSGDEVSEVTSVDLSMFTQVNCESCDMRGPYFLFNPKNQDGISREKLLELFEKTIGRKGGEILAEVASKIWGVRIECVEVDGADDLFVMKEKERKK
jgi:predicted nucleic-acid-binding Zn-ribbon protein